MPHVRGGLYCNFWRYFQGSEFFRERTKSYGCIYKTHILGQRTIRVSGAANVAKILKGEGELVASQWPPSAKLILGKGALAHSKGEKHTWRRQMIAKAFAPEAIQSYIPSIQKIVQDYIRRWCKMGHIHGYPEARSMTFTVASRMLLGFDVHDRQKHQMLILFEDMLATLFSMPVPIPGIGLYRVGYLQSLIPPYDHKQFLHGSPLFHRA